MRHPELLRRHARLGERIRKEELRPLQSPSEAIARRGISVSWTPAGNFDGASPVVAFWDTIAEATDDVSVSGAEITLLTAGIWSAWARVSAGLGADSTTAYIEGSRLTSRFKLDGEVASASTALTSPAAGGYAASDDELHLEPRFLAAGAVLTLELLGGFGAAGATSRQIVGPAVSLDVYLISQYD